MTYNTFSNFTNTSGSAGLDQMVLYVGTIVPSFVPMLLFAIWVIASIGSYFTQQAITGRANFWVNCAVGSYITLVIAFLMSLIPNLVNPYVLVVCFVVAIVSTAILLLSDNERGA